MYLLFRKIYSRARRILIAKKLLRIGKDDGCLRWGIVGTGYMAMTWADLLLESRIGELHAVCSRSGERARSFGRKFGCQRAFDHLEDMLTDQRGKLDFVYVATPPASHYAIIKKCIEGGINVLCEKPATRTAQEWSNLSQLAKQRGVLLVEGMWMLCLPTFRQAEEWIGEGRIGEVKWIRGELNKFQPPILGQSRPNDGILMDYGIYTLSFACHFLGGYPEWCESHARKNTGGDDADWTIVAGRQGKTAVINLSSNFHATSTAAVIGETGVIEWESPFNRTGKISLYSFRTGRRKSRSFAYSSSGFEFQLVEVTQTLRKSLPESKLLNHRETLDTLKLVGHVFGPDAGGVVSKIQTS